MSGAVVPVIRAVIRCGAAVGLVVLSVACGTSVPTAPSPVAQPAAVSVVPGPPPTNFPPASGPSRTFVFDHTLNGRATDYTKQSRFVLYDNGAFSLEYLSLGGRYRGGYTESNGVITFAWEGWSVAGPWSATATLKDGLLDVKYNDVMFWTDFEDAVYRLTPP
jgi:hypothetical protein